MSLMKHAVAAVRLTVRGVSSLTTQTFALVGAALLFGALTLYTHPDLLDKGEGWLYERLHQRKVAAADLNVEPQALDRVTAVDLLELTQEQAAAAYWLSRKYRVAAEPMGALVAEAYALGEQRNLDPQLILAVAAIESRFNPIAQSHAGAQGLMQVMTRVHQDKYAHFGGTFAAFDPVSNLQVGSLILKDCIDRFGGVQRGLVCYVGAANLPNDGGYSEKVLAELARLQKATKDATNVLPDAFLSAHAERQEELATMASETATDIAAGIERVAEMVEEAGQLQAAAKSENTVQ